jgi:hypothetical protein
MPFSQQQYSPRPHALSSDLQVFVRSLFLSLCFLFSIAVAAQVERPIGINLSSVVDYSTEFVFTDAFKQSRSWISHNADGTGPWDTGINIPLDENGYPSSIPFDNGQNAPQAVRALMLWDLTEPFPSGSYPLIVEGEGQISLQFGATGTFTCPVDTLVSVSGGLALRIDASSQSNPISNIQFIRPEYTDQFENQTFTDDLLAFLEDFQVIRFMDWLRTNNSPVQQWSDRSTPNYYTQTLNSGVAWEYLVQLANETEKDIWITIPHGADDNYVTQLARVLEENLSGESQIILEYSNEVWNGIFQQSIYASERGEALGFTGQPWEQGWKYTAYRSAEIFSLFEAEMENDERLVKIIPSQTANPWLSNQLITYFNDPVFNPTGIEADALAIAPYFAGSVANDIVLNNEVNSITVDEIVARMEASLSRAKEDIANSLDVAKDNNLDLITYEGGQHLVGTGGNENIDALTQKLIAANHHPDLEPVYCEYLDYWYREVGQLFTHFSSHGTFSKWGSWGLKETMADVDNPKYLAMQNCVFDLNTVSIDEGRRDAPEILAYPNPSIGGRFTLTHLPDGEWMCVDIAGRKVDPEITYLSTEKMQITLPQSGVYFFWSRKGVLKLIVL